MTCDKCDKNSKSIYAKRPAIPDGKFWCGPCCDASGIELGPWRNYEPMRSANPIREAWLEQQKQKRLERLRTFLASRKAA